MARLQLVIAVLALGVAVLAWLRVPAPAPSVANDTSALVDLDRRLRRLEAEQPPTQLAAPPVRSVSKADTQGSKEAAASTADLARRLDVMEAELAEVRTALPPPPELRTTSDGRVYPQDLPQARKALALTDAQADEVQRIVQGANADLRTLYETPSDTGATPFEAAVTTLKMDIGEVTVVGSNPRLEAVLDSIIPGRRETFRDAQRRIEHGARERIAALLDAEQARRFGSVDIQGLIGRF